MARRHDQQAMTPSRPRIGITVTTGGSTTPKGRWYADAVSAAGGEPVWLEPAEVLRAKDPAELLGRIDGLLLSGGDDLRARHYRQPGLRGAGVRRHAP